MLPRPLAAAILAALALAACSKSGDEVTPPGPSGPVAAVPAPAGKSWADVVARTPEDGVRMGNPNAAIKLVEYGAFTCPHCKHFDDDAGAALPAKYISTGKVSWEFRSTLIHGPDAPITLLMNCAAPAAYFPLKRQLYAAQDSWFEKLLKMTPAEQAAMEGLPPQQVFTRTIELTGLYPFFAARGVPRAKANACLADQAAIDRMTATQQRYSNQDGITGTPTFLLNGTTWNYTGGDRTIWQQLDAELARMTG